VNDGEKPAPEPYVVPTVAEVSCAVREEMKALQARELLAGTDLDGAAREFAAQAVRNRMAAEKRLTDYIAGVEKARDHLRAQADAAYSRSKGPHR
jgi:hypothetical protein